MSDSSSATFDSSSSSNSGETGRRLSVSIATQKDFVVNRDTGYRVVVTVTEAVGMDASVFRYLYQPPDGQNTPVVRYDGVCSPSDMAEFPAGDPLTDSFPASCRRDSVDLVFRSTAEAVDAVQTIREELQTLVDSLNRMDHLLIGEVAVFQ